MKTKAIIDTYKGFTVIGIWAIDEKGDKVSTAPIISMGTNKAKLVVEHIEEFKKLIETSATSNKD